MYSTVWGWSVKVLIIEDNNAIAEAIENVFEKSSDKITVISDINHAIEEYLKGKFTLTILDTATGGNRGLSVLD